VKFGGRGRPFEVTRVKTLELSGWGRYPRARARVARPETVSAVDVTREQQVIARGQGRSYGDAALLTEGLVLLTERLSRFLDFDARTGLLRAEAGTTLADVIETFVPRGWFPAVVPGTKFVSLGGCVAADVHGKNHHRAGSFGAHVAELELVLADGARARCSPGENADLFHATVGGMGLTGVITEVTLRLMPIETAYMLVQHQPARDLDESLTALEDPAFNDEYTVSWIDASARGRDLGRGVLIRGNHARLNEVSQHVAEPLRAARRRPPNLPLEVPAWLLNNFTARALNRLYYRRQRKKTTHFLSGLEDFFFPLDAVGNWNRAYGRAGLVQYQCVLPPAESREGMRELLEALAASRVPCLLAVLKRFGDEGAGLLSFPMPGYTLSLDFPARDAAFALVRQFDEVVARRGGRVYLAKDACLDAETFRPSYPRLAAWRETKARFDPGARFRSDLSRRLGVTP
jgi:decaprenylphospho-beta-D-ribofuranose 2-oxidase